MSYHDHWLASVVRIFIRQHSVTVPWRSSHSSYLVNIKFSVLTSLHRKSRIAHQRKPASMYAAYAIVSINKAVFG